MCLFIGPKRRSVYVAMIAAIYCLLLVTNRFTDSCYVFSADKRDPCSDMKCPPGAKCFIAVDGRSATCECPTK